MSDKRVICKWETDGQLAVIYQLENILLFYTTKNDPRFRKGEMISVEQADKTKPYKAIPFSMESVPNDAYISLTWSWS